MNICGAHFRLGQPIREAMSQLSGRYQLVKSGKTGVIDDGFERYLAEGEPAGLSHIDWVMSDAFSLPGAVISYLIGMRREGYETYRLERGDLDYRDFWTYVK